MKKLSNKKMNKTFRDNLITYGMVIAAYVIMQILVSAGVVSSLLQGLLVPLCTYAILAVSLNLTVGILGELSLGHAGFMCIGAFTSAFFSKVMENTAMPSGLRFFVALLIGAAFAGIFGLLIGIPVLRLKGDYLAIVTLAFGEIIKNLVNILFVGLDENGFHISFTNTMDLNMAEDGQVIIKGAQGITGTPHDSNFTIGIVLLLVTLFIVLNLIHSRDGRAIMAIRDNRIAAESIGINITKYKLTYDRKGTEYNVLDIEDIRKFMIEHEIKDIEEIGLKIFLNDSIKNLNILKIIDYTTEIEDENAVFEDERIVETEDAELEAEK